MDTKPSGPDKAGVEAATRIRLVSALTSGLAAAGTRCRRDSPTKGLADSEIRRRRDSVSPGHSASMTRGRGNSPPSGLAAESPAQGLTAA